MILGLYLPCSIKTRAESSKDCNLGDLSVKSGHLLSNWTINSVRIWSVSPHHYCHHHCRLQEKSSKKTKHNQWNEWFVMNIVWLCWSLCWPKHPMTQLQVALWFLLPSAIPQLFWSPSKYLWITALFTHSLARSFDKHLLSAKPSAGH